MKNITFAILAAALTLVVRPGFGQATDPQLGTWKLNQAISHSDNPGYREQKVPATLKIEGVSGGHHFISDYVDAGGQSVHTEYTAKYDGKNYSRTITTAGKPVTSQLSIRCTNSNTCDYTYTGANGQTSTQHTVISRDRKTRTNTLIGTNAQGQKFTTVQVYEKQ